MNEIKRKTELSVHNIHIFSEAITPKSISIGDASRLILNTFEFSRIYTYTRLRAFVSEHKSKFEANGINFELIRKKDYVITIVQHLKNDNISIITISELIKYVNKHFDIILNDPDIYRIGLKAALMLEGIQFKTNQVRKEATKKILDQTIKFYKKEYSSEYITTYREFLKNAQQFGSIDYPTIHLEGTYLLQQGIKIKSKRAERILMSDESVVIECALSYVRQSVSLVTFHDFWKKAKTSYKEIDREYLKSMSKEIFQKYSLELVDSYKKTTKKEEEIVDEIKSIKLYLQNFQLPFKTYLTDTLLTYRDHTNTIVVHDELSKKFEQEWIKYLAIYFDSILNNRLKTINLLLSEDGELNLNTPKKQLRFLQYRDFHIQTLKIEDIIKLAYRKTTPNDITYGVNQQSMYIGFLLYLHSKKLLILPKQFTYDFCYKNHKAEIEVKLFLKNNPIANIFLEAIQQNRLNAKDAKYKRLFLYFLYTLPEDESLSKINYDQLHYLRENSLYFSTIVRIFNTIGGHIKIHKPVEKYTDIFTQFTHKPQFKALTDLFIKTIERSYKLGDYSNEVQFCKSYSSEYAHFMKFIEQHFQSTNYTKSFLFDVLNYPDSGSYTYQEFLLQSPVGSAVKSKRMTPLVVAFSSEGYENICPNSKIPNFGSADRGKSIDTRKPITDVYVLEILHDILWNRPPASSYHNLLTNFDKTIIEWWPHYKKVTPFEPLILLLHLYIPARGGNFRYVDRDTFLVYDTNKKIKGFYFNHDKNKNRKQPYIAPNIWKNDLDFVQNLIEYSLFHFPHMERFVKNKNDSGILPLFPNQSGDGPYTEQQHMYYWKRVLLKAQLELHQKGHMVSLIYTTDQNIQLPSSSEEIDAITNTKLEKFKLVHDLHSLRHTGATKYANSMMPFSLLMLLTGHVSPETLSRIYVEIDVQRMIERWIDIQNSSVGIEVFENSGKELLIQKSIFTKSTLEGKSPELVLRYLEQSLYFSTTSYMGKGDQSDELVGLDLEDFSKIDPIFWTPLDYGICTQSRCPNGLEKRCSLCPYFLTNPMHMERIALQINLQNHRIQKYTNMIIENRENNLADKNEALRRSALLEIEDMLGWSEILKEANKRLHPSKINNTDSNLLAINNESNFFALTESKNSDHTLLKLATDSQLHKAFDHESTHDVMNKILNKILRYASKNGKFEEVENLDNLKVLQWFEPIFKQNPECLSIKSSKITNKLLLEK